MVTVHPSAPTTLKFSQGKAKAREGKWGLAFGLLCVSTASRLPSPWPSGSKEGARPGIPFSDLTWGAPSQSRVAWPRDLLDKPCLTLRLDDQPKADVSEDQEVEVSDGDTRAVDGASLSSLPGSVRGGVWDHVGTWLWWRLSQVPTCCTRHGQCARQREQ